MSRAGTVKIMEMPSAWVAPEIITPAPVMMATRFIVMLETAMGMAAPPAASSGNKFYLTLKRAQMNVILRFGIYYDF